MTRWSLLLPLGWIGYSAEFAKTFVGFENLKFKSENSKEVTMPRKIT